MGAASAEVASMARDIFEADQESIGGILSWDEAPYRQKVYAFALANKLVNRGYTKSMPEAEETTCCIAEGETCRECADYAAEAEPRGTGIDS